MVTCDGKRKTPETTKRCCALSRHTYARSACLASIAPAGEEVSEDTANHRGKSYRAPSVLSNVIIGCFANIFGGFGSELLPVLKFFGHFSCIHHPIIIRSYTLPNGAGTPDNISTKIQGPKTK